MDNVLMSWQVKDHWISTYTVLDITLLRRTSFGLSLEISVQHLCVKTTQGWAARDNFRLPVWPQMIIFRMVFYYYNWKFAKKIQLLWPSLIRQKWISERAGWFDWLQLQQSGACTLLATTVVNNKLFTSMFSLYTIQL